MSVTTGILSPKYDRVEPRVYAGISRVAAALVFVVKHKYVSPRWLNHQRPSSDPDWLGSLSYPGPALQVGSKGVQAVLEACFISRQNSAGSKPARTRRRHEKDRRRHLPLGSRYPSKAGVTSILSSVRLMTEGTPRSKRFIHECYLKGRRVYMP